MKMSILVLASAVAVLAQAPAFAVVRDGDKDGMSQVLACFTPNLRDAGIRVTVSYGGTDPHYSADVSEISIAGSKVILTIDQVTASMQGAHQIFTDSQTQGERFRLDFNPASIEEDSPEPLNSTLQIQTDTGVSTTELSCHPMSHPM